MNLLPTQTFAALRHRDYRYLWISSFFYSAAEWVQVVTLGWLIYEITHSPFQVGALGAMRTLPFLVIGPAGGVIGDRMDRRTLLILNQVFVAAAALTLAILVGTGRIEVWHLYVLSLLTGTGFAFSAPLRHALVVNTVPRADVQNAVALNAMAMNITRVLGPAVGGLMITVFGAATNFFIQAACYTVVGFMAFMIRVRYQPGAAAKTSPVADLKEGLAYVLSRRRLAAVILLAFIPGFFQMAFTVGLLPVFAKDVLGQESSGLGFLLAMVGVGGVAGTLIVATMGRKTKGDVFQVLAGIGGGVAIIATGLTANFVLAVAFLVAGGIAQMVFISMNTAVIQTISPDALRGRVMSLYLLNLGMTPLGAFAAGALADVFNVSVAMVVGGAATIVLVLVVALRFGMTRAAVPTPGPASPSRV